MTYNNSNIITRIVLGSAFAVAVFAAVVVMPTQAHACIKALGFLDPLCVATGESDLPGFSGGVPALPSLPGISTNDAPQTVNNTYNNSNNVNSNINSPGAVVGAPVAYNTTPVYNYSYPVYNYPNYNNQGPLQVSCYPMPLTADRGDSVTWYASAYGGNGSYNYTWTGTDGLSGYGQSVTRRYYSDGYKNATVTVISGNQTVSRNCDGSVRIRDNGYYYDNNNYNYNYYYNNGSYSPLSVWCSADTTGSSVGTYVRWNANVSGGNGYYTYEWSGTDGIYGSGQSISYMYRAPGQKYASVTVRSDGRVVTQNCSNSVTIGGTYYGTSNADNNNGLDVACYADPATARVNQPITWRAEVVGGSAPYSYSWSGSNDLSGSEGSIIKYYGTTGGKNAIVTVTSADGRKATRACSNEATIRSASASTGTGVQSDTNSSSDNNPLTAAALFSLKNVPWGWVAVLVILVLFGTVMYLLFNRKDI